MSRMLLILSVVALPSCHQSKAPSVSVTVRLPPARPHSQGPGFSFGPESDPTEIEGDSRSG